MFAPDPSILRIKDTTNLRDKVVQHLSQAPAHTPRKFSLTDGTGEAEPPDYPKTARPTQQDILRHLTAPFCEKIFNFMHENEQPIQILITFVSILMPRYLQKQTAYCAERHSCCVRHGTSGPRPYDVERRRSDFFQQTTSLKMRII